MKFTEYLKRDDAKSMAALARELKVSPGRMSQLKHSTDWPPQLALDLEMATAFRVDAGSLSPVIKQARRQKEMAKA